MGARRRRRSACTVVHSERSAGSRILKRMQGLGLSPQGAVEKLQNRGADGLIVVPRGIIFGDCALADERIVLQARDAALVARGELEIGIERFEVRLAVA